MGNFKTKARAIELLGRKQIRDSVTALAELMKNSYDADAPWLRVEFNTQKKMGHIIIADAGIGMTKSDIQDKWLVLGTNSKTNSKNKKSPGGRPLMGAKGIGRLASARLGKQLWMITKSKESLWNIIYINWNLFENPYLSLEEIQIPVLYGVTADRIKAHFEEIKEELTSMQNQNLTLRGWFQENDNNESNVTENRQKIKEEIEDLYKETKECINNCPITVQFISKYLNVANGTILYIDALNDDWEGCFAPTSAEKKNEDLVVQKYYNRVASFVSAFRHAGTDDDPFNVKIYVDNEPWEEDFAYIEEDYELYDIKIDGKVANGKFYGTIDARNADRTLIEKANSILLRGREVTAGISEWKKVDCGPFSLKFCHIEGEKNYTGLSEDDYSRIRRKLDVTGGICVYRDGVRVLPYGEPENDFLNMEERRSFNAGNYVFSHRNIFGRIDIDSNNNPLLEDKSSREGLIENSQYFYFIRTIENLLIDIALNFLSDARKGSLQIRQNFIEKYKKILEEKKNRDKVEKEENSRSKIYLKDLKQQLNKNRNDILKLSKDVSLLIDNWDKSVLESSVDGGYNKLRSILDRINYEYDSTSSDLQKEAENLTITISKRFLAYCSEKLRKEVMDFNCFKDKEISSIKENLDNKVLLIKEEIQKRLQKWEDAASENVKTSPRRYERLLVERLNALTDSCNMLQKDIENAIISNQKLLNQKLDPVKKIMEDIGCYTARMKELLKYNQMFSYINSMRSVHSEIEQLFDSEPENIAAKGQGILNKLEMLYKGTYKEFQILQKDVTESYEEYLQKAEKLSISESSEYTDEYLIGELRLQNTNLQSENEIYSDLANLGLASEIVSHEFNQLYTNVRNAIGNLAPYIREPNAKYWLRQIEVGFRAVSDRQNQLSPMYRSYNLRKRRVKLKDFLDEICSFMSNILDKEGIQIENQVSENVEINLSPSKMFPAISNIVNNASYWVLNKDVKIIRFRYEDGENSLFIEDSGAGITAFDKESIFRPFVSYKPNGRGLGLAIVSKVLESQGYSIVIAKDEEKTLPGACFKITFIDEQGD